MVLVKYHIMTFSIFTFAAAALAVVIGLVVLMTHIDLEKKRLDKGVCPAEITVLQGDGTHYIRYYAELPCDKLCYGYICR